MSNAYAYVWEYSVDPGWIERFAVAYGSTGVWADFFAQSDGYLGTSLFNDPANPNRFITVDYFTDPVARASLVQAKAEAYARIDSEWDTATLTETKIGEFWVDRP
jgi:hypothetical protein